MLKIYDFTGSGLIGRSGAEAIGPQSVWFDLLNPTPEEDAAVEKMLGISVPTRAEMREIEVSNRFYHEDSACYMTAYLFHDNGSTVPEGSSVTFIVADDKLVSVRYHEMQSIPHYLNRVTTGDATANSGTAVLIGLLESIVERKADLIERLQDEADTLARGVFDKSKRHGETTLDSLLQGVGRQGDFVSRIQESTTSIDRVMSFFETEIREKQLDAKALERISIVRRDNAALSDHLKSLSGRVNFLLDATLGMITTEQNQIIKLFSVMAVMLMPPTLVASIYGMNFVHMPELKWEWGYPMALLLMLLAAAIPFAYFKRKGWL